MDNVIHLFAGAGGSHMTGALLGWASAGAVEIDPFCKSIIEHHYPNETVHGDIRTFNATRFAGSVDGVCGGFPCQDISAAGTGAGLAGARSGLWREFLRVITEVKPKWAFIENSPLLRTRGLEVILGDLAGCGFDAEWSTFTARAVGAPHKRDRMWILAYAPGMLCDVSSYHAKSDGRPSQPQPGDGDWPTAAYIAGSFPGDDPCSYGPWGKSCAETVLNSNPLEPGCCFPQPLLRGVDDGLADRVDRLKSIGNGWVPYQAAEAFRQLYARALAHG